MCIVKLCTPLLSKPYVLVMLEPDTALDWSSGYNRTGDHIIAMYISLLTEKWENGASHVPQRGIVKKGLYHLSSPNNCVLCAVC